MRLDQSALADTAHKQNTRLESSITLNKEDVHYQTSAGMLLNPSVKCTLLTCIKHINLSLRCQFFMVPEIQPSFIALPTGSYRNHKIASCTLELLSNG